MKEIKDYLVITANTAADLTMNVNAQIQAGWQPYESIAVAPYPPEREGKITTSRPEFTFTQAMVRYK